MNCSEKTVRAGLLLAACAVCHAGFAASPGVPSIGNTAGGYVAYAETNLPAWFKSAVVEATDNTPVDNELDNNVAELGRVLFYDKRLSHNDGTACASCHTQETGFSDPNQFSEGFEGGLTGRHSRDCRTPATTPAAASSGTSAPRRWRIRRSGRFKTRSRWART